ncbi:helix-turn-helix transcriptional regulator [Rossellomorea vietnamensis]|uniref:helix-turn-helix domain-containing protein n=1 Tax=Rossellomorea vietnamensis TaxID=218284 RepID=UPI001CCE2BEF|nr:helix-turn-helix domain-containing protein [Rossellomorea vietnamensis]MCA0150391.1 helix-turn-helix transcriptional regulator [Rossellomorea vietnamensis]
MDYSVIGKKIKELRKVVGLTQGDLAEGICTQALISRIEKGDIYPSATALYQISVRLGVDVNYFFEIGTTPRIDYLREVERQLRTLRLKRKFSEMMEMVKTEEKNPFFYKDTERLQLLYWHKAIYLFEVEKDPESAFSLLNEAHDLTAHQKKATTEQEMEILMTFGTWETLLNHHEESLCYYQKVEALMKHSKQLHDKTIKTRLFYNMARVLSEISRHEESIKYCHKAITWCLEEEHLWGLGELHYHIGYNYEMLGDNEKALPHVDKAIQLFQLRNDDTHKSFLERRKQEIISKIRGED